MMKWVLCLNVLLFLSVLTILTQYIEGNKLLFTLHIVYSVIEV